MNDYTARPRHPASMRPAFLWAFLPALVLFLIAPSVGDAEVATNITSSGLGTVVPLQPPSDGIYNITGGTRPGAGPNLFHSFGDFSVGSGDIANFLNNTGLPTSNILGRVTGPNISNIYGTIQTNGIGGFGNANLFLVNPSGFVFGPNGSLNVGGSVSFSTAQYLRLFDEVTVNSANFYANPANDGLANSVFAMAPVVEFGFLSPAAYGFLTAPDPSATITVQGSTLSVLPGQSISLVGRDISIQAGTLEDGTIQAAYVSAPGGHINLVSVASPGEVLVPSFETGSFATMGTVTLKEGATLDVSGQLDEFGTPIGKGNSGTVFVRGGQLVMDAATILASTVGAVDGLRTAVDIQVSHDVALSNGSLIITKTSGPGRGGDVQLIASNIQLDGASIQSVTTGDGRGGDISILDAQSVGLTNGAQIVSDTQGGGDGGNIIIATTITPTSSVTISGSDGTGTLIGVMNPFVGIVTSGVFSTASAGGHGGQISITAPNVTLDNEGIIATFNTGGGTEGQAGGDISINSTTVTVGLTKEAFILSSTGFDFTTGTVVGTGIGGNVTIHGLSGTADSAAGKVTLSNGANITSIAGGPSSGGDILISSGAVQLDTGASIISGFTGVGDGGNITVNAGTLSLTNSAAITSLNESVRLGQGGDITVQGLPGATDNPATSVTLSSGANITSLTSAPDGGGNILIISKAVTLDTEASINSSTSGSGDGGNITAKVDTLELMNGASISSKTSSLEFGQGGDITVQGLPGVTDNAATSVTLTNGSRIASEAFGSGDGGQVAITSKSLKMDNGIIATATFKTGRGGDIVVSVLEARLSGGATIKSNTVLDAAPDALLPAGDGGTVKVHGLDGDKSKADSFTASDLSAIKSTAFGSGRLGNIEVRAKTVSLTDVALIQAGTQQDTGRKAGDVFIDADSVSISGGSSIRSQVFAANAGQVTITADQLTLDNGTIEVSTHGIGRGGDVFLNVGSMSLANGATITSSSVSTDPGAGNAGTVTIQGLASPANSVTITDSSVTTSTAGSGQGGAITMEAVAINLSNGTISASTSGTGNAGSITMKVGTLTLTNAAEIASSSTGTMSDAGDAGSVTINASGSFTSNGSKVSTSAENARGGDILIDAQNVQLSNGTLISASSNAPFSDFGEGNAGNITIHSGSTFVMQNSSVTTEASHASGGEIEIKAPDVGGMVRLINSRVSTSVGGVADKSDGGNITIDPQFVILQNSQIIAQAVAGAGGAIDITAGVFLADPASIVDASSTLGISGTVNIESPVQNVGGRLTPLSQQFSSAAALLAQRCAARAADGKFSTFVVAGREGLPVEPGGFLASPSLTAELLGSSLSGRDRHTQFSAVTGAFSEYDARPIQLAMFGNACHQ